jgi:hypothetical protein
MTIDTHATDIEVIGAEITSADVLKYLKDPTSVAFAKIDEDPAEVAARIKERDFSASSFEELFGGNDVLHAKDYLNRPFRLLGVEWRVSGIEGQGLPIFAVLQIVTVDGESTVLTTSAEDVVRKVAKADAEGWLGADRWVKITQASQPTSSGYYPLDISSAPTVTTDAF